MNPAREQFISKLAAELPPQTKRIKLTLVFAAWLLFSWIFVLSATLWSGAFRPTVGEQLTDNVRFLAETILGLAAIVLLGLVAMRSSVPAALNKGLMWSGIVVAGLWLCSFVFSLYSPTFAASMLGKRPHCVWETLVYSLLPLIAGFWLVGRGYVLQWRATGLVLGLAAGLIPVWFMQLACMYDAKHNLLMHLGPALVIALLGAVVGWLRQRFKPN